MKSCLPRGAATVALCVIAAWTAAAVPARAEDAPLPGGVAALARILDVEPAPERARAMVEFVRLLHSAPEGANTDVTERLRRLQAHGEAVRQFQTALAAVQPSSGGVTLAMAAGKNDRKSLASFLDLVGLRLRERKQQLTVERRNDKDALERVRLLSDVGVDLASLAATLNAGQSVRIDMPTDLVPVPFTPAFWSTTIFDRQIPARDLVTAILADRNAALLCHGLMGLDAATQLYLNQRPPIVVDLYQSRAPAFATFASSLVIRDGRVVTPGGPDAAALWQAAVGEPTTRPDRFIHELFGRDQGRLAYLYDTIAHLDPDRRAFAMGDWIADAKLRRERFEALVRVSRDSVKEWDIDKRPFSRTPDDVGWLLATVRVRHDGAPVEPSRQRFWARALASVELPDDPARLLRNIDEDGAIDAAWLVEQLATGDIPQRPTPFAQFEFGQRVFGGVAPADLPDALVAVRAVASFPVLMHGLAAAGIRSPQVYALAARRANALSTLDAGRMFVGVTQFQGALALVLRMTISGTLTSQQGEQLVSSLSKIELADGRYGGALGPWMQSVLGAALNVADHVTERDLLAGAAGSVAADAKVITWEDRSYRVDVPGAVARHSVRVRQSLKGPSIDEVLELDRLRRSLAVANLTLDSVQAARSGFAKLSPSFAAVRLTQQERAPHVDAQVDLQRRIDQSTRDLAKITRPKDLRSAPKVSERLADVVDFALSEALTSLAYASALGESDPASAPAATIALRHDFGFGDSGDARLRTMWSEPAKVVVPGQPWRVRGSLLGLEIAVVDLTLKRQVTDSVQVATISGNDVLTFKRSFALLNPHRMLDDGRGAIAASIERGRARVESLRDDPVAFDAFADEIAMDGWRRSAVSWSLANEPARVPSYFALEELLALGHPDPEVDLDSWGMAASMSGGCLCTSLDAREGWRIVVARDQLGRLPSEVPDLHLAIALRMEALGLPAALTKGVLASLTQQYIDRVRQTDAGDWLALVRAAQSITQAEVEDAVAALTTDGPLVPVPPATAGK